MSAASLALPAAVRMPGHPRRTAEAVPERASHAATGGSEMGGPGSLGP